jgi:hypothetical protein
MSSPDLALQAAIVTKLKADTTLQSLIGNPIRLYQDVPPFTAWPGAYVTIGESQLLPDKAGCIDGSEIYVTLNVWAQSPGYAEVKRIANAITDALDEQEDNLTIIEHKICLIQREEILFRRDTDNVTTRAIMTFRALTEPL